MAAEHESTEHVCFHCRAINRFDACWRCGLWQSKAANYKRSKPTETSKQDIAYSNLLSALNEWTRYMDQWERWRFTGPDGKTYYFHLTMHSETPESYDKVK